MSGITGPGSGSASGRLLDGLTGGVMVCGTTSDAGKSFVVAALCRLLARNGVRVAPFKAQNMANNATVTADGAEIGHAQWVQAVAAGVEPVSAMNPVLLKPTSERSSQVVVHGEPWGEMSAERYHRAKPRLRGVVLAALEGLRRDFDVVICEGAGSPAEINLLDHDIVNLAVADAAGLPALVVGDIDRGGVFAALYGTVALLPDHLRARVRGFVVNRFRGDRSLLGTATAELEARCGVPTLGVLPYVPGPDLDGEDSLTLDGQSRSWPGRSGSGGEPGRAVLDVAVIRWPFVSNAGDLDPLRIEPGVGVRWVRALADLGRPDLVVLPGSKATRADLAWFRDSGLAEAVRAGGQPVVAVCAGLQMCGLAIHDPAGVEGPPGSVEGLGWLPVTTTFEGDKVLDRPVGRVVGGPGRDGAVSGYRIHHGRVAAAPPSGDDDPGGDGGLAPWLVGTAEPAGAPAGDQLLGWYTTGGSGPPVYGTTLHALFEEDGFRTSFLAWVAERAGKAWPPATTSTTTSAYGPAPGDGRATGFAAARQARLDRMADALEAHLDLERLVDIIRQGRPHARAPRGTLT